jgi:hypothetical protein
MRLDAKVDEVLGLLKEEGGEDEERTRDERRRARLRRLSLGVFGR